MNAKELKDYFVRAKDLEAALYTQRELAKQVEAYMDSSKPKKPVQNSPAPLGAKPTKPAPIPRGSLLTGCISAIVAFFGLLLICAEPRDYKSFGSTLILLGGFIAYYSLKMYADSEKEYDADMIKYERASKDYMLREQSYAQYLAQAEAEYAESLASYERQLSEYETLRESSLPILADTLAQLTTSLDSHYSANIIFPKYRNFVAITAICEYLESGRCSSLEGADGAYNLYEMELRQNIVIGQLSAIVDNLEQIRSNQYSLYQEIRHANQIVDAILEELRDIHETARLTAWFASVTALAEASPTYTHTTIS